jgi:flavin-dependent dehydrogenase
MQPNDVTVIGAGLAGLTVARRLADTGFRVLLVERKPSLTYGVHTTGIFVRRTLESFDLPEDCLGPTIRHVTLYSPRGRALDLESPRCEFRVGRMGRLYLELLNRCRAAGVQVLLETAFAGLAEDGNGLLLRLKSRNRETEARTRFLIGADGAKSHVAASLGLEQSREFLVGVENVYRGVPCSGPPRLHCFLDPRLAPGYLGWVVADGSEAHVGVAGDPARFQPLAALKEFRQVAARHVDLRFAEFAEHRSGRIPVGGLLRRIAGPQGLLVGDAAGAVSPLTAGGLDPCLRLSGLAARVTHDYLHGRPQALWQYDGRAIRRRFRGRLAMRRLLNGVRSPHLLELLCGMLSLPPFRGLVARIFFGEGSFPDVDAGAKRPVFRGVELPT